ncbi:probable RNA-directed DNA polymerase from transposon X-element [Trichonephila clavipes]|nr:probable RNA-directed DNA polymerase from transposon X-element [Trichonephila clavipes]
MANYSKCPLYPKPRKGSNTTPNNYSTAVDSLIHPNTSFAQAAAPSNTRRNPAISYQKQTNQIVTPTPIINNATYEVYIPPRSDERLFTHDLEQLLQTNSNCVIFSDLNATHNEWNCSVNSTQAQANPLKALKKHSQQSWQTRLESLNTTDNSLWQCQKYFRKKRSSVPNLNSSSGLACSDDQKANLLAITLKDNFTENERPVGDYPIDNRIISTLENFFSHPPPLPITPTDPDEVLSYVKTLSNNKAPADNTNFISPNQYGFIRHLSTYHPLLRLTEKISFGFQRGRSTGAVFLDIQKAFDRVWFLPDWSQFVSWNANGLLRRNAELRIFIEKHSPDIFLIQETHLRPSHTFNIANYTCHRNDRISDGPRTAGGTLILVKNSLKHYCLPTPPLRALEATNIILTPTPKPDPKSITYVYILLSSDENLFTIDIEYFIQTASNCILFGDFNASHNAWNCKNNTNTGRHLFNFANMLNLNIAFPSVPTRFGHNSANTIDIALIKNFYYPFTINSIDDLSSDHNPVFLNFNFKLAVEPPNPRAVSTDWNVFKTNLNKNLSVFDFHPNSINSTNDLEQKITEFTEAVIDTHIATPPD